MSKIEDGGPAFPLTELNGDGSHYGQSQGMTLRDYFAAKVCGALLTTTSQDRDLPNLGYRRNGDAQTSAERVACISYQMADAMLRARKPQEPSHDRA